MNYSLRVKKELIEGAPRNACCKRAYAAGLLFDLREWREGCLVLVVSAAAARRECARVYRDLYRREALTDGAVMLFSSERLFAHYREMPQFSCPNCKRSFLRGLTVTYASFSAPDKPTHVEYRIANAEKIEVLSNFFAEIGLDLTCRVIDCGAGFYSKKNSEMEEVLRAAGAGRALFDFINAKIDRNIRYETNRDVNCTAANIKKAVSASSKHCAAIRTLMQEGRLDALPDDLRATAKLRLENPELDLVDLALKHTPPITKSGLYHRLQKLIRLADELKKEEK